ncbi:hypothetical protein Tco_0900067 [Tanacetum coccineum]
MIRKLAAQITNKKQCFPKDVSKPKQSSESFKVWEDEPEPMPTRGIRLFENKGQGFAREERSCCAGVLLSFVPDLDVYG